MTLRALLSGERPAVLDGALATALEARGHELSDALWSARLLRDDPAAIEAVHAAYLEAGARVLITASYQASEEGFARAGIASSEAAALLRRSVEIARGAPPAVVRERTLFQIGLAGGRVQRVSLPSELCKEAAAGARHRASGRRASRPEAPARGAWRASYPGVFAASAMNPRSTARDTHGNRSNRSA